MDYNRTFTHRTYGKIGVVTFTVPKGKYILNGTELPESSVAHLMTFALQTLQDAYAGAKSTDEALGAFNGKLDKLLNGTIGTRGTGDGADERTRVARQLVRGLVKAKYGSKSSEWAAFTGLDDAAQAAKLDAMFAANEAALSGAVDEKIAELAAARAKRGEMAKTVEIAL
jgi:hypothetical protein